MVGLGNPGREYEGTRHNVGFMIVERLAQRWGADWKTGSRWQADLASAAGVWLCKPLTYMNRSGGPTRAVSDFYKITPSETLVIYDEAALPLGRLRIRRGGSSAGHNGIQSVIDHLGTPDVPRIRVGIGGAVPEGMTGHVLGRFSKDEAAALETVLNKAVEAVECVRDRGIEAAMNQFNPNQTSS